MIPWKIEVFEKNIILTLLKHSKACFASIFILFHIHFLILLISWTQFSMAKTYTQILTQSNLGICKLFYNSNNFFFFFLQSNSVLAIWFCDVRHMYVLLPPPKKRLQTLQIISWVLLMLIFIKEKNLERSTHWKNKLLQPFPLMTCLQKVFFKFRELQTHDPSPRTISYFRWELTKTWSVL